MTDEQIAALGPAFAAELRRYRDCFGQDRTARHFDTYCRGLLSDPPRKSVEPIALASGTAVRTLQEFLVTSTWDIAVSAVTSQSPFDGGGLFTNNLSSDFFLDANLDVTTEANALFRIRNLNAVGTETTFSRITGTNAGIDFLGTAGTMPTVLSIIISDTFNVPNGPGNLLTVGLTVLLNSKGNLITSTSSATPDGSSVSVSSNRVVLPGDTPGAIGDMTTFNGTGAPFTLTNTTTINFAPGSTVQFQSGSSVLPAGSVEAVPAPSALILAAVGLPAFGVLRRRFAKPATPAVA